MTPEEFHALTPGTQVVLRYPHIEHQGSVERWTEMQLTAYPKTTEPIVVIDFPSLECKLEFGPIDHHTAHKLFIHKYDDILTFFNAHGRSAYAVHTKRHSLDDTNPYLKAIIDSAATAIKLERGHWHYRTQYSSYKCLWQDPITRESAIF